MFDAVLSVCGSSTGGNVGDPGTGVKFWNIKGEETHVFVVLQ